MEESDVVTRLSEKVTRLSREGLKLISVMHMALSRGIQPLQA